MCKCFDVANYFLRSPEYEDPSEAISNMKLQKLMYFAQGHALAILDRPLFPEDFEAWRHGPVIPSLYRVYRRFGSEKITPPEMIDLSRFTPEEKDLLESVWLTYGGYSAWGLRNLSHSSTPWKNHKDDGSVIPKDEMRSYFLALGDEG